MTTNGDIGEQCATPGEARRVAVKLLLDVARDILPTDGPAKRMTVKVRDEANAIVLTTEIDFAGRQRD